MRVFTISAENIEIVVLWLQGKVFLLATKHPPSLAQKALCKVYWACEKLPWYGNNTCLCWNQTQDTKIWYRTCQICEPQSPYKPASSRLRTALRLSAMPHKKSFTRKGLSSQCLSPTAIHHFQRNCDKSTMRHAECLHFSVFLNQRSVMVESCSLSKQKLLGLRIFEK